MQLGQTWFYDGTLDFELKQYTLLAYLQEVEKFYKENKLYPSLSDLISHYHNLSEFKETKLRIVSNFPKHMLGINSEKMEIIYEQLDNGDLLDTIGEIVDFSIPRVKEHIDQGTKIYDVIENEIKVEPIGIIPIYKREGYLMFRVEKEVLVYKYNVNYLIDPKTDSAYNMLETKPLDKKYKLSLKNTYENIKGDLIKENPSLPNPATYLVETDNTFPLQEAIVPISKRKLIKIIAF